jgi:thiosulfate dehydrogenase (quinone) large subunit
MGEAQDVVVTRAEPGPPDRWGRASLVVLRLALGVLWLSNSGWKRPPDFGEERGVGLHRFTSFAVEHEVFPPYAWFVETVVLPNFRVFGWVVLVTEALLGAFLLLGLLTRFWGLVGAAMSLSIALSVLMAPEEWPWAYYLMIGAHLVVAGAAAGRWFGLDGVLRPVWGERRSRPARWATWLS